MVLGWQLSLDLWLRSFHESSINPTMGERSREEYLGPQEFWPAEKAIRESTSYGLRGYSDYHPEYREPHYECGRW
jgi:hypothetical protein